MKTNQTQRNSASRAWRAAIRLCLVGWAVLSTLPLFAADDASLTDKTKEALHDAKVAVQDAGAAAAESIENLWRRVDENRLKNRTPDEIVAWAIMGVLVGSVAGMMTSLKSSGLGNAGRLLLGLAGAFIGGMVVHVALIDFGWGPVMIRYEELLFSLLGAVVLIAIGRLIRSRVTKQSHAK